MEVNEYIRELLVSHDCVILPGLGGFVANYKSAKIDGASKSIYPPSKTVLFNKNLKYNDGLLIGHLSKRKGISYENAERIVTGFLDNIKACIAGGKKFVIDKLGYFYADPQHGFLFQEELGMNLLVDSYGLSFIHYKDIDASISQESLENKYIRLEQKTVTRNRRIRHWVYAGAAASVIATMILVPTKTSLMDRYPFDLSSVNWFKNEIATEKNVTESTSDKIPVTSQITYRQFTTGSGVDLEKQDVHHIIVGSFRNFGNARMMRLHMIERGFNARILAGQNGFFRVSAKTCKDKSDAIRDLNKIKQEQSLEQAWILSE